MRPDAGSFVFPLGRNALCTCLRWASVLFTCVLSMSHANAMTTGTLAAIHGTVTLKGGGPPAKAIVVVLKQEIDPKTRKRVWVPKYSKEASTSGRYQIEGIDPGTYNLMAHDEDTYDFDYRYKNEKLKEGENREFSFQLEVKRQSSLRGKLQGFSSDLLSSGKLVFSAGDCDGCVIKKVDVEASGEFLTKLVEFQDYLVTFESEKIPESKKLAAVQISLGSATSSYGLNLIADNGSLVAKLVEDIPVSPDVVVTAVTGVSVTQTIQGTEVQNLPINGRRFADFTILSPGVSATGSSNATNSTIAGSASTENKYLVDLTLAGANRVTYAVQPAAPSTDNELQLAQSGYSSRRGTTLPGDQTNVVTSAGSNQLHGLVDYRFRNDALDARNFFSLSDFNIFRNNAVSVQLSGPLKIVPRAFFSLAYDFSRATTSPTFSPGLTSQVSALNQQFLRLGLLTEDLRRLTTTSALDTPLVRLDYNISGHDSVLLRYSCRRDILRNDFSVAPLGTSAAPSAARTVSDNTQFFTIQFTHAVSSHAFVVSYRYRRDAISFAPVEPNRLSLLIPGLVLIGRTPNLATGDYEWQANHLLSANLGGKIHGKHTIGLGAQFGFDRNRLAFASFDSGRAIIPSFAALSAATPIVDLFEVGRGDTEVRYDITTANYYFQDTYEAKHNLTFTFGIRNKIELPPSFQHRELNGLQPSVSFAWDIQNKGRTVLRVGYAMHRERRPQLPIGFELLMGGGQGVPSNTPSAVRRVFSFVGNSAASAALSQFLLNRNIPPGPLLATNYSTSSRSPMFQAFTVRLENELRPKVVVELSYLYEHGDRILTTTNVNLPPPVSVNGREDFRGLVLNPAFAQIYEFQTVGKSSYSGLSLSGQVRGLKGVWISSTYTLSRMIDDVAFGTFEATPENVFDRANDRSLSDFHLGKTLFVSGRWDLPKPKPKQPGQKRNPFVRLLGAPFLQGTLDVRSGRYFNVTAGFDANHDGNPLTDRPISVGRNTFLGPRFAEIDLQFGSLFRSERKRFQWSVDVFNLFNHTNFASVNTVIGSADLVGLDPRIVLGRKSISGFDYRRPLAANGFGLATSAFSPRRIQIGLKFSF